MSINFLLLTDLCSSEYLPEVEIFSLLEEQIPKYKLRADTLTQFAGYQNEVSEFTYCRVKLINNDEKII